MSGSKGCLGSLDAAEWQVTDGAYLPGWTMPGRTLANGWNVVTRCIGSGVDVTEPFHSGVPRQSNYITVESDTSRPFFSITVTYLCGFATGVFHLFNFISIRKVLSKLGLLLRAVEVSAEPTDTQLQAFHYFRLPTWLDGSTICFNPSGSYLLDL